MARWKKGKKSAGPARKGKVVTLSLPRVVVQAIHIATPSAGGDFAYLYEDADTHPIAPGALQGWARGPKVTAPEWERGRPDNLPACVLRARPVALRVKLVAETSADLRGTLSADPTLDGRELGLGPVVVEFTYPAGVAEHWVVVRLDGAMPQEIGRFVLAIRWRARGRGLSSATETSTLRIYALHQQPYDPAYDSPSDGDAGKPAAPELGTVSGTPQRLDKVMRLAGGKDLRHAAATKLQIIDLLWKLHVGINDTPGAPPYFDALHDEHITHDGDKAGTPIPLEDQWLAWVTAQPPWNDASCIGHVQLLKTMAAAIGLFARRAWIFPTTSRTPDGATVKLADTDCYCLGTWNPRKQQSWPFTLPDGRVVRASPRLMEPNRGWENFEACLRAPSGYFLPGGYETRSCPPSFRAHKGFRSAKELLRWWSRTSRRGFGKRFMCWVYRDARTRETHLWDVDGTRYALADYVEIREAGKQLPPP